MIAAVRPQADFLRQHDELLNDAPFRADVALYLPFKRWVKTDQCAARALAAVLTKENVQYRVVSEDDLESFVESKSPPPLLVESLAVFTSNEQQALAKINHDGREVIAADKPDWLRQLRQRIPKPAIKLTNAPNVRAVVHEQHGRMIVHLYNLNVRRLSSFEDKVTPVTDIGISVAVPANIRSVRVLTADEKATSGPLKFTADGAANGAVIETRIPRLDIHSIVVIEP
jgi:hypothetical protein